MNDILGFDLTLDPSNTYTIETSGDNILFATQHLTNYWGQNHYYAVYHVVHSGTEKIIVKKNNSEDIFTVVITVL